MGGYMQQLIEAVNASNATTFLDWAPIILSVISVLIAVYIPVKLARKENQIAIFEKLYAAYSQLPRWSAGYNRRRGCPPLWPP